MAIEIVDLPINNGDFPVRYVKLPEGNHFLDGENGQTSQWFELIPWWIRFY